jgi:MFS family permease
VYWRLIRENPNFTRLWISQIISLLGDWFSTIVLAIMVREFTRDTGYEGIAVSALFLAQALPPLIASPIAGVLVDRFNRKQLLVWSNLLRAVVVLGFLLVQDASMLWLLYTLRVIQFFLSSVFEPGQSAIIPSLINSPEQLSRANTILSTTWSVMLAVGAVIGGIVGGLYGPETAIIVDAITFVVAGGLLMTVQVGESAIKVKATTQTPEEEEDLRFIEALRYLRRYPNKIGPILVKGAGSLGNVDTLLAFYATNLFVLGTNGELSLGILYSVFGLGAMIGPFVLNRFHDDGVFALRRMVLIGFVWIPLGWLLLGFAPTIWIAAAALALRAMGNSVNWVYSTTMVQKSFPDAYLGRMFSLDMAGYYLASVISTIVHGILIDVFGSDHIRAIVYGTMIVSLLPLILWGRYILRQEAVARHEPKRV